MRFEDDNFYFGDNKLENFLLTFTGWRLILGDLGCAMQMNDGDNYVSGCIVEYALKFII